MTSKFRTAAILSGLTVGLAGIMGVALAGEEHGHCTGANVCKGDAACEKQGWKEMTKDECAKFEGAKFADSDHAGEGHKDEKHDHAHDKK